MATLSEITTESIRKYIFSLADEKYRQFHSALVPGEDTIIGVRVPVLRKYAGELYSSWKSAGSASVRESGSTEGLLEIIGDVYYEEIMLKGMIIGMQKVSSRNGKRTYKDNVACLSNNLKTISIDELYIQIENFVPKINNWAVCDTFCAGLKQVKKYPEETYELLQKFLKSDEEFSIRFGLVMLLDYYIKEDYLANIFDICDEAAEAEKARTDDKGEPLEYYYVKMAIAWLISTCFIKFYDETLEYMAKCRLDDWTYNKALQKARESMRLTSAQKDELKAIKR